MENVTLEPELEEALASASDAELCDIAGEADTHTFKQIRAKEQNRAYCFHFSPICTYSVYSESLFNMSNSDCFPSSPPAHSLITVITPSHLVTCPC